MLIDIQHTHTHTHTLCDTITILYLIVESGVTEFLPEHVQPLLDDLLPVRHGELSQRKQDGALLLGEGLQ